MDQNRDHHTFTFQKSASTSSMFTNNLVPRIKMPSLSLEKTTQQQATTEKVGVKEHDKEAGNKLFSLHGRLRQEADKIRQWKLQTETELKLKEKKIIESTQTIENLKKYVLELQIQNENLSLKMQEEVSNREETSQKIDSTRELCNILKKHVQTLENKTFQCEAECNELKYQERGHFEEFKDLSLKFKNLNISATEEQNKLKSEITKYSSDKEKLGKCLEKSIQDSERQSMVYAENLSQKESQIKTITEKLKDNENQKVQQEEVIAHLNSNIQNLKHEIESKESRIEHLIKEVDLLTKTKCQLSSEYQNAQLYLSKIEQSHKSLKTEMSEQSSQHSQELEALQLEVKDVKEQYEKLKEMHKELNIKQANSIKFIEDLKSEKDILILEKANVDMSLKNEINSKSELETTLEKKSDQLKNLNRFIIDLNDKLDASKTEHSKTLLALKENKNLLSDVQNNFAQITKEKELLQKDLDSKTAEHGNLQDKMKLLAEREELKMEQCNKDLAEIKNQNSQLTKNLSDMKMKMKLEEEKYKNHINELEKCQQDNNITLDKYKSEKNQLQSQIEGLKKDIHQLQEELRQCKKENETLLIDKQTFENMTKQKEAAERETKQTVNNCEIQRQEMMSTLEKYKKENQKMIDIKEKEIETIRTKSELQNKELENKFNSDLKEKTSEWEKENQKLKDKISELDREITIKKRENKELQLIANKEVTNNEIVQQFSNNSHLKTPIFLSRKTPQKAVLVTPQQVIQHTPLLKAKSKVSRKRKVVFNPEKASFMSDTDSSVSEYVPLYCENNIKSKGIPQPFLSDCRVQPKIKENILKDVQENIPQSKNQLENEMKKKDFSVNVLSKEICDEIKPKKTKSGKKTSTQNLKKTKCTKSEISKSPTKANKNSEEELFWFDTDSIFGFGMDD